MLFAKRKGATVLGSEVAWIRPGEIMVQKMADVVFLEPTTHNSYITDEVLSKWIGTRKKIADWIMEFSVANSKEFEEAISPRELLLGKTFADSARIHRSSGLLSASCVENAPNPFTNLISDGYLRSREEFSGESYRKRSLSDDKLGGENFKDSKRKMSDEYSQASDPQETKIKGSIDQIFKMIGFITEKLDKKDASSAEEIKMLFSNLEMINSNIGTRSTDRTDRFEVPTIWGSIALLSGTLDRMHKDIEALPTSAEQKQTLRADFNRMEQEAMKTVNIIIEGIENQVKANYQEFEQSVRFLDLEFKQTVTSMNKPQDENDEALLLFAKGASVMKNDVEKMKRQFIAFVNKTYGNMSVSGNNQSCSNYVPIPDFLAKMITTDDALDLIRGRIDQMVTDIGGEALKSFGLGFRC